MKLAHAAGMTWGQWKQQEMHLENVAVVKDVIEIASVIPNCERHCCANSAALASQTRKPSRHQSDGNENRWQAHAIVALVWG